MLKKNAPDSSCQKYNYDKGIDYYEEVHQHLIQCNHRSKVYAMGMELILQYGLKFFLNKFKRKEAASFNHDILAMTTSNFSSLTDIEDSSGEIISLLAEMIQATGNYYGAE